MYLKADDFCLPFLHVLKKKRRGEKDMVAQWKYVHWTMEGNTIACYQNSNSSKRVNESEQTNAKPKTEMNKMYYMYIKC